MGPGEGAGADRDPEGQSADKFIFHVFQAPGREQFGVAASGRVPGSESPPQPVSTHSILTTYSQHTDRILTVYSPDTHHNLHSTHTRLCARACNSPKQNRIPSQAHTMCSHHTHTVLTQDWFPEPVRAPTHRVSGQVLITYSQHTDTFAQCCSGTCVWVETTPISELYRTHLALDTFSNLQSAMCAP